MNPKAPITTTPAGLERDRLIAQLRQRTETDSLVRRAIGQFNAGNFDSALRLFETAKDSGATGASLARQMACCYLAAKRPAQASVALSETEPTNVRDRLRLVSCLVESGKHKLALSTMREAIASDPECTAYHFHLGTMLADRGEYEEAELRFAQVLSIDRDHIEALVQLAMCYGARGQIEDAFAWLQRAQAHRPGDCRIGIMVTQAAKALAQTGISPTLRPTLRAYETPHQVDDIERLSIIVESDPEFIEAFLAISGTNIDLDQNVYSVLLATLQRALERQPEHAEWHHHVGRVLDHMGQAEAAIDANERAIALDVTLTAALIDLGRLYQKTDRHDDAITRLEQAIHDGADYADVHFLLGSVYRKQGHLDKAKRSFVRALTLNDQYQAAAEALEMIPA